MKRGYVIEILIWFILILATAITIFGVHFYFVVHKNTYNLYFNDVDGVIKGSPVRFMGVLVGHVRKLKYNPTRDEIYAQIVITKKDVKIPNGSKAKVEFTGIVGSKSIEILPPDTNEKCIGIIVQNPLRIADMVESFEMYNRAVKMTKDSLVKFNNQNADLIIKNFAKSPDLKAVDNMIDNGVTAQKKFNNAVTTITKNENELVKKVDKWQKKLLNSIKNKN